MSTITPWSGLETQNYKTIILYERPVSDVNDIGYPVDFVLKGSDKKKGRRTYP